MGLDMNGTHRVLVYRDGVNLIGDYIKLIENTDVLNARKDMG